MNKYIDADKLIAEIERRIQRCEECERDGYPDTTSSEATLKSLRSFITSLQQEQPEVDLVAELKHHLATTPKDQLEKEWKELEPWGNIGPTVQEFLYGKQPEVDLEKFTEKINTFQGRYKYPEIISIKGAMGFMARLFYQYPNVAKLWYEQLPKATMD